jgi:glycerophosphoryl diester phosphodiesterase
MRKRKHYACAAVALTLGFVYFNNAACFARPAAGRVTLLAHRGVHQRSACKNVSRDTCTAVCIAAPTHDFLENTLRSMRAAFELGADIVELDIHPTTDGQFAVFHDWTLDCRTNGSGVTRTKTMAYLKSLDIGYGYTADSGETFPFRGRGVGMMPTLAEVLDAFPDGRFLVHIKGNDPAEGEQLARFLLGRPVAQRRLLTIYGGERPVERTLGLVPGLRGLTRSRVKSCAKRYAVLGWTGYLPRACRNTMLVLPENRARLLWGWPHRFISRMHDVGTEVFVAGPLHGEWLTGIDSEQYAHVTEDNYSGGVWTDRIEVVGPLRGTGAVAR